MRVCVYGLWHLGCVTSVCLAELGHRVVGLDPDPDTVEGLRNFVPPVYEPGLGEAIRNHVSNGTLQFTQDSRTAFSGASVLWLTFDTPVDDEDHADVQFVMNLFYNISEFIPDKTLVIVSSQVPVGTTRLMSSRFHTDYPGKKCFFAYSPENLKLGRAIRSFLDPDRIVIGTLPEEREIFHTFFSSISEHLVWMGLESAEMTKHAINAFLAASVTFANEIASLCEYVGADAKEVELGLKTEERIGLKAYLGPGNAYSGGTLGRDISYLQDIASQVSFPAYLIRSVQISNNNHKSWVYRACLEHFKDLEGKKISVLGLTYKPGTNTLRRSFAIELCVWLKENGAMVRAYDPAIPELPSSYDHIVSLSGSAEECVNGADALIIATEWPVFQDMCRNPDINLSGKVIIDPTGFLKELVSNYSYIRYYSVGRRII